MSLVEGGVLVTAAAGLATTLDLVPQSLEGLIGSRINALTAAEERALTIAAVIGPPVQHDLVAAVTARLAEPYGEVTDALAGLREHRMLEGEHFVHALGAPEHGVPAHDPGRAAGRSTSLLPTSGRTWCRLPNWRSTWLGISTSPGPKSARSSPSRMRPRSP